MYTIKNQISIQIYSLKSPSNPLDSHSLKTFKGTLQGCLCYLEYTRI